MATTKVRVQCGRIWLEVDAQDVKEAFRSLSNFIEAFSETTCGACGAVEVNPVHRRKDDDGNWLADNGWSKFTGKPGETGTF